MISIDLARRLGALICIGFTLQTASAAANDISCEFPDDAHSLAVLAIESLRPEKIGSSDAELLATLDKAGFGGHSAKWLEGANMEESMVSIKDVAKLPLWLEHARVGDIAAVAQDYRQFFDTHGPKEENNTIFARLLAIYAGPPALDGYLEAISDDGQLNKKETSKSIRIATSFSDHDTMAALHNKQDFGYGTGASLYGVARDLFWAGEHDLLKNILDRESARSDAYRQDGPYRSCVQAGRLSPQECRERNDRTAFLRALQTLDIKGWSLCRRAYPREKSDRCFDALEARLRKEGFDPQPAVPAENDASRYTDNTISYFRSLLLDTETAIPDSAFHPFDVFSLRAIIARRAALKFSGQTEALLELINRFEQSLEIVPAANAELAITRTRPEKLLADVALSLFHGSPEDLERAIETYRNIGQSDILEDGFIAYAKAAYLKRRNSWAGLLVLLESEPREYHGFNVLDASHQAFAAGDEATAAQLRSLSKQRTCERFRQSSAAKSTLKTHWFMELFTDAAIREGLLPAYFSGKFRDSVAHYRF